MACSSGFLSGLALRSSSGPTICALLVMPLIPQTRVPEFRLEADASASTVAAIFTDLGSDTEIERIHRELSRVERRKSSTLRELLGYANEVRVISQKER